MCLIEFGISEFLSMSVAIKLFVLCLVTPQKHLKYIIDIIDIMCISFAFFSGLIFLLLLLCYSFYIFFWTCLCTTNNNTKIHPTACRLFSRKLKRKYSMNLKYITIIYKYLILLKMWTHFSVKRCNTKFFPITFFDIVSTVHSMMFPMYVTLSICILLHLVVIKAVRPIFDHIITHGFYLSYISIIFI